MKIDKYLKEKFIFKKEKSFFKFIYMYSQKILKDKPIEEIKVFCEEEINKNIK